MKTKLNTRSKQLIRQKILSNAFDKKLQDLVIEEQLLVDMAYNFVFTEDQRLLMNSLPEGWLPTTISLEVAGNSKQINLNFQSKQEYRLPNNHCTWRDQITVNGTTHPTLREMAEKLQELKDTHFKLHRRMEHRIDTALYGYRTAEKLMKEWPEIAEIVKEVLAIPDEVAEEEKAPFEEINKELGITQLLLT